MPCENVEVKTVFDFIEFLHCLRSDWEKNAGLWANPFLPEFLESMAKLLEKNCGSEVSSTNFYQRASWAQFAGLMRAATRYQ